MSTPVIRPARIDEHDEVARVWMESWATTGLNEASDSLFGQLQAQIHFEAANGWDIHVADDSGTLAAMLALHVPKRILGQIFILPEYQGQGLGRRLLAFTRQQMPEEIRLRCVRENEKAWRWYEREGFRLEREVTDATIGFVLKYYRWRIQKLDSGGGRGD